MENRQLRRTISSLSKATAAERETYKALQRDLEGYKDAISAISEESELRELNRCLWRLYWAPAHLVCEQAQAGSGPDGRLLRRNYSRRTELARGILSPMPGGSFRRKHSSEGAGVGSRSRRSSEDSSSARKPRINVGGGGDSEAGTPCSLRPSTSSDSSNVPPEHSLAGDGDHVAKSAWENGTAPAGRKGGVSDLVARLRS